MSNIIPYVHQGEVLIEDATTQKFQTMWNAAASIDDDAQEVNVTDLNVLRRMKVVSHDGTVKTGIGSLRELGECLIVTGQKLITMADNKRFLCTVMERRERVGL
jgi:hypothetical protein